MNRAALKFGIRECFVDLRSRRRSPLKTNTLRTIYKYIRQTLDKHPYIKNIIEESKDIDEFIDTNFFRELVRETENICLEIARTPRQMGFRSKRRSRKQKRQYSKRKQKRRSKRKSR